MILEDLCEKFKCENVEKHWAFNWRDVSSRRLEGFHQSRGQKPLVSFVVQLVFPGLWPQEHSDSFCNFRHRQKVTQAL